MIQKPLSASAHCSELFAQNPLIPRGGSKGWPGAAPVRAVAAPVPPPPCLLYTSDAADE